MFVLHACWLDGLLLWAEGGAPQLVDGVPEQVNLLVPAVGETPLPSPQVPVDTPVDGVPVLRGTRATAVRVGTVDALDLLGDVTGVAERIGASAVPRGASGADSGAVPGESAPGEGLRFLALLAEFARDLVRRGRVLPWAVGEGPDTARAVWLPVLTGADAVRARAFVAALPDAVRAVVPEASPVTGPDRPGAPLSAAATVADALDRLVDAGVRASLPTRAGTRRGRSAAARSAARPQGIADAWQAALLGEPCFPATPEQLDALVETLAEWQRDVTGGALRAWFRLVEPPPDAVTELVPVSDPAVPGDVGTGLPGAGSVGPGDVASGLPGSGSVGTPRVDTDLPWRIEFGLQAADEPSLAVDAARVWGSPGALTALARHVEAPQEVFLTELGRAYRLWPGLEQALRTARPTHLDTDTAGAHAFLAQAAPSLAAAGFGVLLPSWWGRSAARVGVRAVASSPAQPGAGSSGARFGQETLVDFRWRLAVGDELLTQEEIDALATAKQPLVRVRGQWVSLDEGRLRAGLDLVTSGGVRQVALGDLLRQVAGGAPSGEETVPVLGIDADGWLAELLGSARPEPRDAPPGFVGRLRPYQERGLGWLTFLQRLGLGGVLADDMGLGKTVQLLALVAGDRALAPDGDDPAAGDRALAPDGDAVHAPTLLVCPMSLVGNWKREAARFTPELRVHVHHGAERPRGKAFTTAVAASDLVITTYALAARDVAALRRVPWRRVVLDEAQAVKNAATKAATAIRSLPAAHRIAVTGTPVENRLADLWSLMEFANPGLLGTATDFRRRFATPVERNGDPEAAARLRAVTQPFVLRRLKTDRSIIADLPEKLEMDVACTLTREQASLYQAVVDDMMARIAESDGMERRGLVLATMTKLKQVCNHPAQLLHDASAVAGRSGKLQRLEEILEEVLSVGEKALLFTQFAEFGALLRAHLSARLGREVLFLHGGVAQRERDLMVERFQDGASGSPPLFVLSLKAGGTGLTLTAASHVVHVDRWWNPAVEDQASDRAHRIGQTRTVQVRRLVCAGTLEERISQMIADKRGLAAAVVGSGEGWLTELSTDALRELVALEAGAAVE